MNLDSVSFRKVIIESSGFGTFLTYSQINKMSRKLKLEQELEDLFSHNIQPEEIDAMTSLM